MREYTKHQIRRIRDLNEKYFEVLFQKDSLKFTPGCAVTLYNNDPSPIFIASGIGEVWVRIILNRDLFQKSIFESPSIKLNLEIPNLIPELMDEESPNFVLDSAGIAPFFSYVSTYPKVKCKVCYLGEDKIQEDWVKLVHKDTSLKNMKRVKNLYVIGNRDLMQRKAEKLLNTCKTSYLI